MRKARYPRVKLDAFQQRAWEDTLAALSWVGPGFIHILYTMLSNSGHKDIALFTDHIPATAGTDGFQMIISPKRFFKYKLLERVFVLLHEIMHEILNHCRASFGFRKAGRITVAGKSLDWDDEYANRMQDYVINAILIACKMGLFNADWLYDLDIATDKDDWVTVYFRQWKNRDAGGGQGKGKGKGKGKGEPGDGEGEPSEGRFDMHLDPHASNEGVADESEVPERSDAQWEIAVKTAMEIQRAQGKLPGAMEMFFKGVLAPKVDWTDHIEGLIKRMTGSGAYDWRKLDRRLVTRGIGAPGLTGHGAGLVIIAYDTSGSIFVDPTLIDRFRGETGGIMEDVQPEKCMVIECDAAIHRVTELTDPADLRLVEIVKGGGGSTDFRPVFAYIAEHDLVPDCVLYLTDMFGSFPDKEPEYPVIWGAITDEPAPWGKVVRVPVESDLD